MTISFTEKEEGSLLQGTPFWKCQKPAVGVQLSREGVPFQGPRVGSCQNIQTLADKARHFIGKGAREESSRIRAIRRTALPHGSQSWVLW